MLAVADALSVLSVVALLAATGLTGPGEVLGILVLLPLWLLLAKLLGLYDADHRVLRHLTTDELPRVLDWAVLASAGSAALLLLSSTGMSIQTAVRMALGVALVAPLLRATARALWRWATPPERAVVVGTGSLELAVRRKLELFSDVHLRLVGELDEELLDAAGGDPGDVAQALRRAADGAAIERVVLASASIDEQRIAALLSACRRDGIKLSIVPPARGAFGTAVQLEHLADLPLIEYSTWDASRSTMLIKRVIDVVIAVVLLAVLAPVLALIAVAVRLDTPGRSLFVHRRAGMNGAVFGMLKFRSMVADAERRLEELVSISELPAPVFKLRDDPRITRSGRLLRRFSLDELPQLINVLRGQMSLVGPRPEQVELVERYAPEHRFRLEVKPGMTGPMQVYGRGRLSFEERLAVERDYIENISLGRDLRLLLMTVSAVVRGEGAF